MGRSPSNPNNKPILPPVLTLAAVIAFVLLPFAPARANVILSYDASTDQLPNDPPFRYVDTSSLYGSPDTPTISDGVATLGPTGGQGEAFWYTDQIVLPHVTGFDISADLRLDSESSSNPTDDSGLAIAFSDDRSLYQNLFINPTGVFFSQLNATDTGIIPDTSFSLDTAQWHDYSIQVLGDNVTLSVDGTQEISSTLFNLNATGQLVLPDYAALGDIVPGAQSQFDFNSFSVVVPEPSYASAVLVAIAVVIAMRLRRPAHHAFMSM